MVRINREICDLCGACLAVCPPLCMEIIHFMLKIDNSTCIECGKCINVCPLEALEMSDDD